MGIPIPTAALRFYRHFHNYGGLRWSSEKKIGRCVSTLYVVLRRHSRSASSVCENVRFCTLLAAYFVRIHPF